MTLGTVTLLKQIRSDGTGLIYRKLIVPISKASYGMYLMHLMPLPIISDSLRQTSLPTPVIILTTAAITFLITAIVSIIIQRIPKIGKYIVG